MSRGDRRLGKGLGALLGEYLDVPDESSAHVKEIPIAAVSPNPFQPRREFAEDELEELSASIRENGLLQPIVVRPAGDGAWQLVAGERRWRAITRLGWAQVPAVVREVDDRTLLVLALVENLQRSQLSAIDEALGYKQLADQFGLSQREIAGAVGRNRSTVANTLRLLQLPGSVRRLLASGELDAGHARALLGLDDERRMAELARRAVAEGWSVRRVEEEVGKSRPRGPVPSDPPVRTPAGGRARTAAEKRLEEELQRTLGTEARIKRGRGGRGSIEIPFLDAEDFERLFELLTDQAVADLI